jgi:hypothetical protein
LPLPDPATTSSTCPTYTSFRHRRQNSPPPSIICLFLPLSFIQFIRNRPLMMEIQLRL